MILIQGRRCLPREHPSIAPSVAPSVALSDFFLPFESGDKLFDQPTGPSGAKPPFVAIHVPKYSENDLQKILKAVMEAWAPALAPALALTIFEVP